MITKTTNLDDKYRALYDEIRAKSNGAININSLEQFFGNIIEIAQCDKKFLRLPLDEPIFEIDANTRVITIPNEFRTNGLSVQGDHLAEIVFFSIDRYFDRTDLSNTDITINWKMGTNVGKTKYFIMSKDIIPGKVIFGWPIDNIITQKSGSLTFAVEFSQKNAETGELKYNFNTLAASINIKDGLIIGSDVEPVSLDDAVTGILTNSVFGEGDAEVGQINWISGNGEGLVRGVSSGPSGAITLANYENPLMLNTIITPDGTPQSVPVDLYGQAYVDDGTVIVYTDSSNASLTPIMLPLNKTLVKINDRANLNEDKIYYNGNGPSATAVDFEDITDTYPTDLYAVPDLDVNQIFYVKIEDSDPVAYRKATSEEKNSWYDKSSNSHLYIEMAKITASEDGTYIIKAQGIKRDTEGNKIGNGEISSCTPIIIPKVENPSDVAIEKSSISISEDTGYSFDEETGINTVFLNNGEAQLTASAIVDNYGALQFIWQKKVGNEFVDVNDETPAYKVDRLAPGGNIDSVNNDTLNINETGEYRVKVKNFQNGKYSDEIISKTYTASELASEINDINYTASRVSAKDGKPAFNSQGVLSEKSVTLTVNVDEPERGELVYEWLKDDKIVGNSASLVINVEGYYTPIVKNIYNGSVYTKTLDQAIFVNDEANDI